MDNIKNKKYNQKNFFVHFATNLSVAILIFLVLIFVFSSLGFLFKQTINYFYIIFAFLISALFLKKHTINNKDFLVTFLTLTIIFILSFLFSSQIYDNSWDGRSSHYAEIILLKNGWNPIFDNYKEFCKVYHVYEASAFWGNSYMRFFEVVGANFYKYFGLIECSKMTNFFMFFACYFYSFSSIKTILKKNNFLPLLLSFLLVINPVVLCQIFTNYIDANLYFAFTIMIFAILKNPHFEAKKRRDCFAFCLGSLILSTCKFSAMAYCFVVCFLYLLFLFLKKRNVGNFLKAMLIVLFLFVICTISPLYTNYKNFKHPFYPIMGENKINIFTPDNYPARFKGKNIFYKYFMSTVSESVNTIEYPSFMNLEIEPKIPFTISIKSIFNIFNCPDMRICGFGYFWSGILCLNLFLFCFLRFNNRKDKELFYLCLAIILLSTFSNPECWCARYAPQQWLFPIISMIFFVKMRKNNNIKVLKNILFALLSFAIISNSSIVAKQNFTQTFEDTKYLKQQYQNIANYSPNGIYLTRIPAWENMIIADESTIPHLMEKIDKIIFVEFDEISNSSKNLFYHVHNMLIMYKPTYFFRPIN